MASKNASGAQKRKVRANKEIELKNIVGKCQKLSNFFQVATFADNTVFDQCDGEASMSSNVQSSQVDITLPSTSQLPDADISYPDNMVLSTQAQGYQSKTDDQELAFAHRTECNLPLQSASADYRQACFSVSDDPAAWTVTNELRQHFVQHPPIETINDIDFSGSVRMYGDHQRYCSKEIFYRILPDGEKKKRDWLKYSKSKASVFCYICQLFSSSESQFTTGFSDWKHATKRLSEHESSVEHRTSMLACINRTRMLGTIDSQLIQQYEAECQYWREVLKRVAAVVCFLAEHGLPFRGENEIIASASNGVYLGCLELLAKFDPFLKEHMTRFGNKGRGHVNYLSSTICEEFITCMGKKVLSVILGEIQAAKYFSICVDSTPDVSHTDQLTLIIRYVSPKDHLPVERFLTFVPIDAHNSEYLVNTVLSTLGENHIDIQNCHGQSYDNASNMSGQCSGLQARIKQVNSLVEWIPCAAHSLNLVGSCAAECCPQAVSFFGLIQGIYTFFSASTGRWTKMTSILTKGAVVLKRAADTRWSSHYDACHALAASYKEIRDTLCQIASDMFELPSTRHEAKSFYKKMQELETGIMSLVWKDITVQFHKTSKTLQTPGISLDIVVQLYSSLTSFFQDMRGRFQHYEQSAKTLVENDNYCSDKRRKRSLASFHDDSKTPAVSFSGSREFEINTFYAIIDKEVVELTSRAAAYVALQDRYGFLTDITCSDTTVILRKAADFVSHFKDDLEETFPNEFLQFVHFCENLVSSNPSPLHLLHLITKHGLQSTFPNVEVALRIYLCLMCTNCERERSFSIMSRVKSNLRSTMGQTRLLSLSIIAIESDVARTISFDDVIDCFAAEKTRRRPI